MRNIIKKNILWSVLIIVLIIEVIIFSSCAKDNSRNDYNWTYFPMDMSKYGFLSYQIVDDLQDLDIEDSSNGTSLYFWKKYNNANNIVHKIELRVKNKTLEYYHYKNYDFKITNPQVPLSKEDALKLVNQFAEQFLNEGEKLQFKNTEGASSLYDTGHVEGWEADLNNANHLVMVDLDMGCIVCYERN